VTFIEEGTPTAVDLPTRCIRPVAHRTPKSPPTSASVTDSPGKATECGGGRAQSSKHRDFAGAFPD